MTTVVLVQQGGTGSNNASDARSALGAAPTAAYDQANAAYSAANSGSSSAGAAYAQANAAYAQANTAYGQANASYSQANLAYTQANSAFTAANNSNLKSGGLISGTLNVTNDMIVGGNIYLQGNTTFINVATYQVNDPLMYIAANNILTDSVDIGFVGAKNTSGVFSHTGFARDATDGKYKLFDNLADSGHVGNVIDFANTSLATLVANVEANTLSVVNGVSGNVDFDSGTLFVDSVGNRVGVGTTNPVTKFDVFINGGQGLPALVTGERMRIISNDISSRSGYLSIIAGNSAYSGIFFGDNASAEVGKIRYYHTDNSMQFFTNNAESLRIDGSGNVGIGTTAPTKKLHVVGSTIIDDDALANNAVLLVIDDGVANTVTSSATFRIANDGTSPSFAIFEASSAVSNTVITNAGNIGIGITAPTSKLHVVGTANITSTSTFGDNVTIDRDDANLLLRILNRSSSTARFPQLLIDNFGDSNGMGVVELRRSRGNLASPASVQSGDLLGGFNTWGSNGVSFISATRINGVADSTFSTSVNAYMQFLTTSAGTQAERMRITANGDVSIGTSVPVGRLHVQSSLDGTFLRLQRAGGSNIPILNINLTESTNLVEYEATGAVGAAFAWKLGASERMRITSAGNVGVGTAGPTDKLQIEGTGTVPVASIRSTTTGSVNQAALNLFRGDSTNGFAQFGVGTTNTNTWQFGLRSGSTSWQLYDVGASTSRVVVDTSGNVGIGTTNPAGYKFRIAGTSGAAQFRAGTDSNGYFEINAFDSNPVYCVVGGSNATAGVFGTQSNIPTVFFSNNTERMRITSAGSVGIGTTSPSTTLDVNGTITCTTLTETSSITFKENVDPITDALNFITKLVGVTYDRKDGSAKQKAGLIAEEVNEVLPNLVQKDSDGNAYGIHYTNLIAYLVESIKELNDKIERLESNR